MKTPHIQFSGLIDNDSLKADIKIPVTLNQALWVEYKGCWFWKRVKATHHTISSDNPYVEIKYSEYIQIEKISIEAFILASGGFYIGEISKRNSNNQKNHYGYNQSKIQKINKE